MRITFCVAIILTLCFQRIIAGESAGVNDKFFGFFIKHKSENRCSLIVFDKNDVPQIVYIHDKENVLHVTDSYTNTPDFAINNVFVDIQLDPVSINCIAISTGRASRIKRGRELLHISALKSKKAISDDLMVIGFWFDDLSIIPYEGDKIESFYDKYFEDLLSNGKLDKSLKPLDP